MRRRAPLAVALGLLASAAGLLAATADDPGDGRLIFGCWHGRDFAIALLLAIVASGAALVAASREAAQAYALGWVVAALLWAALETAGGLGLVSYPELLGRQARSDLGTRPVPLLDVSGQTRPDTASTWGLATTPVPFHYVTNELGFRNIASRNEADVYLLGDSILVASLLPFEETLAARLEQALGRPVMNIALIGIGVEEEQELFRASGLPVRDRLVLQFVFEGNDLLDARAARQPPRAPGLRERSLAFNGMLALQALTQPVAGIARRRVGWIDGELYTFRWVRDSFDGLEREIPEITAALEAFGAEVRAGGGSFGVVLVPSKLRVLHDLARWPEGSDLADTAAHLGPLPEALAAWRTRAGVPLLDLTEPLRAAAREGRIPWFPTDTHPNAEGHRVASQALAAWPPVRSFASRADLRSARRQPD
jgi:hypothetical protein